MFGGVIGKDSSEKFLSNKLFFLPIGQNKTVKWVELEISGKPPIARFYHD